MPKRTFDTLEEFRNHLHREGATLIEFSGKKVPCILVDQKHYEDFLREAHGKKVRAETMLDLFYDGHEVFVDLQIKFSDTDFDQNYLLYANHMLEFFEALADTGLIAFSPDSQAFTNSQNIFMVQLPQRDAAVRALEIIKANAKGQSGRG